jgi:hypothetical protein
MLRNNAKYPFKSHNLSFFMKGLNKLNLIVKPGNCKNAPKC